VQKKEKDLELPEKGMVSQGVQAAFFYPLALEMI
jgi:hypothetical protein